MTRKRWTFDASFKLEVVKMIKVQGLGVIRRRRRMNCSARNNLSRCPEIVDHYKAGNVSAGPGQCIACEITEPYRCHIPYLYGALSESNGFIICEALH